MEGLSILLRIIIFIIVLYFLYLAIKIIFKNWYNISSPANINNITKSQNLLLEDKWTGKLQMRKGIKDAFTKVPKPQHLLINTNVLNTFENIT